GDRRAAVRDGRPAPHRPDPARVPAAGGARGLGTRVVAGVRRGADPVSAPMARGPVLVPAPLARGRRGAVVAPHHLATEAGIGILRAGGSAVDAAIATNAVLAVVVPSSCGIGGDAFWLIWEAATGREYALNGSGRAPASADPAAIRDQGLDSLPLRGPRTITVPGAVRSWGDAHRRFGRLPREQ